MATVTQYRTLVGTTGVSGAQGYTGLVAAHAAAITTAVAGLTGITGYVSSSTVISNTILNQDSNGGVLYMTSAINYVTSI